VVELTVRKEDEYKWQIWNVTCANNDNVFGISFFSFTFVLAIHSFFLLFDDNIYHSWGKYCYFPASKQGAPLPFTFLFIWEVYVKTCFSSLLSSALSRSINCLINQWERLSHQIFCDRFTLFFTQLTTHSGAGALHVRAFSFISLGA